MQKSFVLVDRESYVTLAGNKTLSFLDYYKLQLNLAV